MRTSPTHKITNIVSSAPLSLLLSGVVAFSVGGLGTLAYVKWQGQEQRIDEMSIVVEQLLREQAEVSRAASVDMIRVAPLAEDIQALTPEKTTVDKLNDLVLVSLSPNGAKFSGLDGPAGETIAATLKGVDVLSEAVVNGQYVFTTRQSRSGNLRILFDQHGDLQPKLEDMLSKAAQDGTIDVNAALRDSSGKFDGSIILLDLIQRDLLDGNEAKQSAGMSLREEALALLNPDRLASIIANQQGAKDQYYIVQPGDSLAYLALQFFGNASAFEKIFAANRSVLSSPEKIRIGQKLLIPKA